MLSGHGDDIYRYKREITINFSSNVYPNIDLDGLKTHLCTQMDKITAYPHPEAASLRDKIAGINHLSPDQVCLTNGSIEAIYLVAQVFQGKRSGILIPAFSEYADACKIHRHHTTFLTKLENLERFDMIWMCNPNNPTGKVIDKERLLHLLHLYPEVVFVIDQAYEAFTEKPVFTSGETITMPNVILLHSLTKKYAIPGLRLGYITAQAARITQMRAERMPWSVNSLAISAGHYVLDQVGPPDIKSYLAEKKRLSDGIASIEDLQVMPSDTHFMLIRLRRGKPAALKEFLVHTYGILIRDASNFQGLNGSYIRIATQKPAENDGLLKAIRHWFTTF